ncbi:MAG TPA: hypothetical protein VM938_07780 [Acidimicrobiales bacterium]|nr:hypothetical protein [Acidimicrobiales bacterium]
MLKFLRVVGVVLALVVVGVFVNRLFEPRVDPGAAVSTYLDAVRRGETPATCKQLSTSPDDFSGVDGYRIVRTTTLDNRDGRVVFDATRGGQTHTYEAVIVREGTTWKWCGLNPTGP